MTQRDALDIGNVSKRLNNYFNHYWLLRYAKKCAPVAPTLRWVFLGGISEHAKG